MNHLTPEQRQAMQDQRASAEAAARSIDDERARRMEEAARAAYHDPANIGDRYHAAVQAAGAAGASVHQAERIADELEAEQTAQDAEAGREQCQEPRCFWRTPNDGRSRSMCIHCIGA